MSLALRIYGRTGKLGSLIVKAIESDAACVEKEPADIAIDVSHPEALKNHIGPIPLIIGSTGHSDESMDLVKRAAKKIPLMLAPNFSTGIGLLSQLTKRFSTQLSPHADITEIHHQDKLDTPSGTALHLANILDTTRITSYRRPGAVGEHRIFLTWGDEEIEIVHKAKSRQTYALGALKAAKWLIHQPPGLYHFEDCL